MIEFLTLFLGLTWGVRPVEVAVGGPVAAVEIRLDGATAARMDGPPWKVECDFGQALVPHVLEAVALDAEGRRVAATRQTINFGRSEAEASLILEIGASQNAGEAAAPRRARVVWQVFDQSQPKKLRAWLDGQRVPIDDEGWIELPPYDPRTAHLLEARVSFDDSLKAEAERTFGGTYSEQVASELTAVPVVFPAGGPPRPQEMAGWFTAGGKPLTVFSVEQDPGVVFLVRDYNLPSPLPLGGAQETTATGTLVVPPTRGISKHEVRFVATTPRLSRSGGALTEIFLIAPVDDGWSRKGIATVARFLAPKEQHNVPQRLFESLALAGRGAAATARPRAVLLLLDPAAADHSRLRARQAREYLQSLRVPLFVWADAKGQETPPSFGDGGLDDLTKGDLEAVAEAVVASLRSQHVVWFQGGLLPHQIELTSAAPAGVRLAF